MTELGIAHAKVRPCWFLQRRLALVQSNPPLPHSVKLEGAAVSRHLQAIFDHTSQRGLRSVQVSIEDNCILLTGTVRSFYLKQMAQERVRKECPTTKLCNDLVVQSPR